MPSPMSQCNPGEWYFVIVCKKCGTRMPLLNDLSKGESHITRSYKFECPFCEHVDVYEGEDLERYEHSD